MYFYFPTYVSGIESSLVMALLLNHIPDPMCALYPFSPKVISYGMFAHILQQGCGYCYNVWVLFKLSQFYMDSLVGVCLVV